MKKIAIVSCYFQKNYGSMLQAYATQKALDFLGYENETLCIDGIAKEIRNAKLKHYFGELKNIKVVKGKLGIIKRQVLRNLNREVKNNIAVRDRMFTQFMKTQFRISEPFTRQELSEYCNNFSSVLVGSDQLWLPSNIDADYYTLSFVPKKVNKIAYATSFGVSDLPKRQWSAAKEFLNRINYVSVREERGREIVKEIANRNVPVVCDPTLLFDGEQWEEYIPRKRLIKEKYLFCYFLGNNPEQRDFVKRVKMLTGYKIVSLLYLDEYVKSDVAFPDYAPFKVGPAEFVNLIRYAEYIFTDSFHGSIFSTMNQKKFFTFRRFAEGSPLSTNSRIHSLLEAIGLKDRFITAASDPEECLKQEIDYNDVLGRVEKLRQDSKVFLLNALEGR